MYYLDGLNEKQKEAVLHTNGPLLILAGAGAGKTKTITHRILHLVKNGIAPKQILAITFTNKAAREMRERVVHILSKDHGAQHITQNPETPFVSTFHALGVTILKEHARLIGLTRHFGIADRADSLRLIKESLSGLGMDPKQYEPGKILSIISREKGNMVDAESFAKRGTDARVYSLERIVGDVWASYEQKLLEEKMLDFDDLILKTYLILKKHPEVLAHYQQSWTYIHVDEYQDTNKVQYGIVSLLAEKQKNLCVVGDIDQNIYSWRGADIQNILNFEKDYPEAKVVLLEENYRSTKIILAVANAVIKKNKMRREKNLFTQNGEGAKVGIYRATNEGDEATFIAQKAKDMIQAGSSAKEMAVLYRANFQSRAMEEAFLTHNVPYQMLGTKFFERKEIKDILAFVRAGLDPEAMGDVKRIINVPARGLGKVTILKIFSGQKESLSGMVRDKVDAFYRLLGQIGDKVRKEMPSMVVKFIIQASGLEKELKDGTEEEQERLENMMELVTLATKYDKDPIGEGIEKLLTDAALASDQDTLEKNENAVKLMTVHASKGLEFDTVFIAGLEEELFPHQRMGSKQSEADLEEERRLFYVALTRARKKLFLSYTEMRMIYGNTQMNIPSQFLGDIDAMYLEEEEGVAWTGKVVYLDL